MTASAPASAEGRMSDAARRVHRRSRRSIFQAFLQSARRRGAKTLAVIDGDGRKLTYQDIARGAFAIAGPIARRTVRGEKVGVLLPTSAGILIAFLAILARGRVPAMLNFTAGAMNLKAACKAAQVTRIVTAKKFIEMAGLEKLAADLSGFAELVYLEDAREELTRTDKARALLGPLLPSLLAADPHPDDTGVVLFTSGTEGAPKGVALSHANILANAQQISEHVEIEPTDTFFNPLPAFHCYGLTAGTLWPVLAGYPVVLHPSPLQAKIISKRIFETGSTIILATDTFLNQYMRASDEGGLNSLRIAVCGAERVRDETRQAAERRFSFEVLEGYGVTEASPVIAANQPGDIRAGTVGRLLPGMEARLEPVEGLPGAGRLFVRGPNVMKGYITADAPGVIKPLGDGWHDTGDVVAFDENGYMAIRGRLKRFAKIGGEMISLAVVENCACAVWPDHLHGAVVLPDARKGEQIVLVTSKPEADRSLLLAWAQSHGVPEIAVPRKIICAEDVPVLGTGKLDYVTIERMAEEGVAALEARAAATPEPEPSRKALKEAARRQRTEEKRLAKETRNAQRAGPDQASAPDGRSTDGGPIHSSPADSSGDIKKAAE